MESAGCQAVSQVGLRDAPPMDTVRSREVVHESAGAMYQLANLLDRLVERDLKGTIAVLREIPEMRRTQADKLLEITNPLEG